MASKMAVTPNNLCLDNYDLKSMDEKTTNFDSLS